MECTGWKKGKGESAIILFQRNIIKFIKMKYRRENLALVLMLFSKLHLILWKKINDC